MNVDIADIPNWTLERCVQVRWLLRRNSVASKATTEVLQALSKRIKELEG